MVRYYAVFKGQVQGVGFRYYIQRYARDNNVTGWARNRYDGAVEAMLQGNNNDISEVISKLNNTHYIEISDYCLKEMEIDENETGFNIIY